MDGAVAQAPADGVVHDLASDGFAVMLLLRCVDPVRLRVDRETVHLLLDRKIFELSDAIGIIDLECGYRAARARNVDPPESRVELDDVRPTSQRQKRHGLMRVQVEHRHQLVPLAREKRPVVLRVQGHAVVAFTAPNRVTADHLIGRRIGHRENVLILQIDIHLPRHGIILRHPGFTGEVQRLDHGVGPDIDDRFGLAALVRDVQFVERRRVGAPVRLRFGLNLLDHLHLLQIDDADGVVARIGRVKFLQLRNVFDPFGPRCVGDGADHAVGSQVNHICLSGPEVRGEQIAIVGVHGQIVESLPARTGQVEFGDHSQRRDGRRERYAHTERSHRGKQGDDDISHERLLQPEVRYLSSGAEVRYS